MALVTSENAPAKKKKVTEPNKKIPSNKKPPLPETEKLKGDKVKSDPKKPKENLKQPLQKNQKCDPGKRKRWSCLPI